MWYFSWDEECGEKRLTKNRINIVRYVASCAVALDLIINCVTRLDFYCSNITFHASTNFSSLRIAGWNCFNCDPFGKFDRVFVEGFKRHFNFYIPIQLYKSSTLLLCTTKKTLHTRCKASCVLLPHFWNYLFDSEQY